MTDRKGPDVYPANPAEHLRALGSEKTDYKLDGPSYDALETFPNPMPQGRGSLVDGYSSSIMITCPEFTSLCPKTGQPDFATIEIEYRPRYLCIESKSLKLYLFSFRNHGEFHEACVSRIARDLINKLDPLELKVVGKFTPRGGIPFWPTVSYRAPRQ